MSFVGELLCSIGRHKWVHLARVPLAQEEYRDTVMCSRPKCYAKSTVPVGERNGIKYRIWPRG